MPRCSEEEHTSTFGKMPGQKDHARINVRRKLGTPLLGVDATILMQGAVVYFRNGLLPNTVRKCKKCESIETKKQSVLDRVGKKWS